MINVEIRKAVEQDFEFVYEMIKQLNEMPEDEEILSKSKLKSIFQNHLANPSKFYDIATLLDVPIGLIIFSIDEVLSEIGNVLTIHELVVDKKYRGKSVGEKLIHHVSQIAKVEKCALIETTTNLRRIKAHHFYEKCGLHKNGYRFGMDVKKRFESR